jgi:hypothetical protein
MKKRSLPNEFRTLGRALENYDLNDGFSYALADDFLQRMFAEPGTLARARTELEQALNDPQTPWPALLVNDHYQAGDELEPSEAKEQVLNLLWDALYPELPPRVDPDGYRVLEVSEGGVSRTVVERSADNAEVALIKQIGREATTLTVEYRLLDTGLLPAVLRKHLRKGVCSLLAGSPMLEGVQALECINTEQRSRVRLPC